MSQRTHLRLPVACTLVAIAILVADFLLPIGDAGKVLLVSLVLISCWLPTRPVESRDDSSTDRANEAARKKELRGSVFTNSSEAIFIKDLSGRIVDLNRAAERQYGWTRSELLGESIKKLVPPDQHAQRDQLMSLCAEGVDVRSVEVSRITKSGEERPILISLSLLTDNKGRPTGIATFSEELILHRQAEEELRRTAQRLVLSQSAAHVGTWDWDLKLQKATCSDEYFRLHGLEPGDRMPSFEEWKARLHPDDRERAAKNAVEALEKDSPYEDEFRVVWSDGSVHWLSSKARVFRDDDGQPTRMIGVNIDITRQKDAEQSLRDSEAQIRAIFDTAADAIVTIGENGKIRAVNRATERMFGYTGDEMIGQNVKILMPPQYRDEHDGYVARYLKTRVPKIIGNSLEVIAQHKDGPTFPIDLTISVFRDATQTLFTGILRDISEHKQLQRDVLRIAEDEQRRIGQDLHDGTQQELAGLGMLAQTLLENIEKTGNETSANRTPELSELASRIVEGIDRTHEDVKTISRGLVPIRLEGEGLMDALRELACRTDDIEGVTCAFKCEEPVEVTDSSTATHLYRIAQEAIANALKHGKPEHILIALEDDRGRTMLNVADDGRGFESSGKHEGIGLKSMFYRASLIGASVTVNPVETGGTLVSCQIAGDGHS